LKKNVLELRNEQLTTPLGVDAMNCSRTAPEHMTFSFEEKPLMSGDETVKSGG
jgi:hypothetical protein